MRERFCGVNGNRKQWKSDEGKGAGSEGRRRKEYNEETGITGGDKGEGNIKWKGRKT